MYTYQPARFVPLLVALFAAYLLLWQRHELRRRWRGLLLLAAAAVLVALPLAVTLSTQLGQEVSERAFTLEPLQKLLQGEVRPILQNTWATLQAFTVRGDPLESYNVPDRPIFFPAWTGVFFYAGVLLAVQRWRQPVYALLLLWLAVMLLPTIVTLSAPNFNRMVGAQPPVMALAALPMAEGGRWLVRRWPRWGWAVLVLVAGVVLGATAVATARDYFVTWPATPGVAGPLNRSVTEIALYLEESPENSPAIISAENLEDMAPYIVDVVMDRQDVALRWADTTQALAFPAGADSLRLVVAEERWVDPAVAHFAALPGQAQVQGAHFAVYALHVPVWSQGGLLPTLPAGYPYRFSGGEHDPWGLLALESLTQVETAVAPGGTLTFLTTWHILADGQPASLASFMHLLNDAGEIVAQYDGLGYPPHTWRAGDRFVQAHSLPLPAGLQPGAYELRLGLYRRETGARWRVLDGSNAPVAEWLLFPLVLPAGGE